MCIIVPCVYNRPSGGGAKAQQLVESKRAVAKIMCIIVPCVYNRPSGGGAKAQQIVEMQQQQEGSGKNNLYNSSLCV
jgi:hypothetical protein